MEKSCHNCLNAFWYTDESGKEHGSCDEYGFYKLGFPANIEPPYDDACEMWTDEPEKANRWKKDCYRTF